MTTIQLLEELRAKNIQLWFDGEKLRFKAPAGAMTADIKERLKRNKEEIITFLASSCKAVGAEDQVIQPVSFQEQMPLSFAQRRLWFLELLKLDEAAYNILMPLKLTGDLNVDALNRACNTILQRHRVLRNIYTTDEHQEPVQMVHPSEDIPCKTIDISGMPPEDRETEIQRLATEEAKIPFSIEKELPVRTVLVNIDEESHMFMITIHHIAADAWSLDIFTNELACLYESYCTGQAPQLSDLPIQYMDFAHWQRNWLRDNVLVEQLAYWKKALSGAPSVLDLPTDRPRSAIRTSNGCKTVFSISDTLTQQVKTLSRREDITPFMILLTVFQTLLYRYTGQTDILVGSPIAGRKHSGVEKLIGFFVNTLVLRSDFSDSPTARDLFKRVRKTTLDAYAHQDLPFEKLVEELRPERNLSFTPLFQAMFNYYNTPWSEITIPGLKIEYLNIDTGTSKFDLNMAAEEVDDRIICTVVYNSDLFDQERMVGLGEHFTALLEQMIHTPDLPVVALPIHETLDGGSISIKGRRSEPAPSPCGLVQQLVDTEYAEPQTDTEKQIATVWRDVLEKSNVGLDDNFFDIGGESFKAIRVAHRLGDAVGVMDLFRNPTIRELAGLLDNNEEAPAFELLYELTQPRPSSTKTGSVVCIPYGAGNAIVYQPLADQLPDHLSLYSIQIPGHDFTKKDKAIKPLIETAAQCAREITEHVTGPIVLYGHCVGGALAVEIARQMEAKGVTPAGVVLGGTFPNPRLPGKLFDVLARIFPSDRWESNRGLYEWLVSMGGFTDVMDPEEKAFLTQTLRHDIRGAEDYYTQMNAAKNPVKLETPILAVVGERDRATEFYQERYQEWYQFSDAVSLSVIEKAGHYFLKHQAQELASIIAGKFESWMAPDAVSKKTAPEVIEVALSPSESSSRIKTVEAKAKPEPVVAPSLIRFLLVAFGQFVSLIGTGLTSFALGVWVYQKTGSVTEFAFITVFALLPGIVLLPVAGALVDRWDKRLVMIWADVVAACGTVALFGLLLLDALQIWQIYMIVSINSMSEAFQRPAYLSAIPKLVPKQYLGRANGIAQLAVGTGTLLAVLLGGTLVLVIGLKGVIIVDFVAFLIAIVILLAVSFPNRMFKKREEPLWSEITGGWRYILKRPGLTAMVIYFVVFNFFFSSIDVLVAPLVLAFESAAVLGMVLAADGLGRLLGGLVMGIWGGTKRRAEGMIVATILVGIGVLISGLQPLPAFIIVGFFAIGVALSMMNAHWQAMMQIKVGQELLGRVLATNQMLAWSMIPIGFLLTGPLADFVFEPLMMTTHTPADMFAWLVGGTGAGRGVGLMMVIVGAILTLWGIMGFAYKPLRYMEDHLPDAIPDAVISKDKDEIQKRADELLASTKN